MARSLNQRLQRSRSRWQTPGPPRPGPVTLVTVAAGTSLSLSDSVVTTVTVTAAGRSHGDSLNIMISGLPRRARAAFPAHAAIIIAG